MATVKQQVERLRSRKPLIYNITNVVVTNFTANGLYALGASPVMGYAAEEAEELASAADALVLNIGTLTAPQVEVMLTAGRAANKAGTPVILDPVGAGATTYRTEVTHRLLRELDIALIRGNAGEISSLLSEDTDVKGVDGSEGREISAAEAARSLKTVVCVTGRIDQVSDGSVLYHVHGGTPALTDVTGTGCLLTSCIAAFISADGENAAQAAAACAYYSACAKEAERTQPFSGPGSFQQRFLDMLQQLPDEAVGESRITVEEASY
ncbi:hydroxyethylthiazole kinase [Alkalicoccus urumqiensis]|uniref:Hydroxyethylthiazole kinase n=1 Tax=Alkalicoccus urumqiensis TaxID=1548213 RepID=A0A2P6MIN0_ALKUR|nr:hydroxyethylthiazole kinase [Alkalicoccus urumqiensis]PRO66139.1 hydroxyethylthiazole kinase [Alkalicoccus urumqiensis]